MLFVINYNKTKQVLLKNYNGYIRVIDIVLNVTYNNLKQKRNRNFNYYHL